MNQATLITIISTIFTVLFTSIVGFFFWLLKSLLLRNFESMSRTLDNKVNIEGYTLKIKEIEHSFKSIDDDLKKNETQHIEFYEGLKKHDIWEAKRNGCTP